MTEKLWKQAERKLCKMLGGIRRGPTGRDESDCCHDWLSVEVKCNRKMPAYIQEWMAQTWCNAELGKLPILVWHQVGDPYSHALVSMRLSSFLEWFGDGEEALPFTDVGWPDPQKGVS